MTYVNHLIVTWECSKCNKQGIFKLNTDNLTIEECNLTELSLEKHKEKSPNCDSKEIDIYWT